MATVPESVSVPAGEAPTSLMFNVEADLCEKLHDDAEHLFRTLSSSRCITGW
ncbi:hypothetical protein [Klebsiella quasipneumoniae]|uniref:hypothetical protein n=1 Tax=Klebsiella quasipneumoniae TaxID=1463165 RepID=UPI003F6E2732